VDSWGSDDFGSWDMMGVGWNMVGKIDWWVLGDWSPWSGQVSSMTPGGGVN
jgi:hypothetical protein